MKRNGKVISGVKELHSKNREMLVEELKHVLSCHPIPGFVTEVDLKDANQNERSAADGAITAIDPEAAAKSGAK